MARRRRTLSHSSAVELLIAGVLSLGTVVLAGAHPLGSFSIDHYSRLQLSPEELKLRFILDMAEISSFEEMQRADTDRNQDLSDPERRVYLAAKTTELTGRLMATVNGAPLEWQVDFANLTVRPATDAPAGTTAPTFRLALNLHARLPSPLAARNTVRYTDQNYAERTGWKEIVVQADPGIRLIRSTAAREDVSNELTRYPERVFAPPQDLSAELTFEIGADAGVLGAVRSLLGDEPWFWLMCAVAIPGLFFWWRAVRRRAV